MYLNAPAPSVTPGCDALTERVCVVWEPVTTAMGIQYPGPRWSVPPTFGGDVLLGLRPVTARPPRGRARVWRRPVFPSVPCLCECVRVVQASLLVDRFHLFGFVLSYWLFLFCGPLGRLVFRELLEHG